MRVYFTAYRRVNTKIFVYYKIISRDDTLIIEEANWQQLTSISKVTRYPTSRDDLIEFEMASGTNRVAQNYVSYTNPRMG
jgi:hypothetical protein